MQQLDLSVTDYTSKIKDICDSLASIDVNVEQGEMLQIYIGGLASKFGAFRNVVCTRDNTSLFSDLQSMLLVEENHAGTLTSMHAIAVRQKIRKSRKCVILRDETRSELDEEDHPEIGRGVVCRVRSVKPHDVP